MSAQHTPLPWRLADNDPTIVVTDALDGDGNCSVVADVLTATSPAQPHDPANAAFIVRACNSHYELLEALELLVDQQTAGFFTEYAWDTARAAIAKATGAS